MKTLTRFLPCMLMFILVQASAQTDSTHRKKTLPVRQKIIPNTTKLELVYRNVLVGYHYSNGAYGSANVSLPFVRVNDSKPLEIDKRGDFLRKFYTKCNVADLHIDLMNEEQKKANIFYYGGAGTGVAFLGAGLGLSGRGAGYFWTGAAVGAAVAFTGAYIAQRHVKKAEKHLWQSVEVYNSQCYKPLPSDSSHLTAPTASSGKSSKIPEAPKLYRDTTLYRLLRNDPANSNMYGLTLSPLIISYSGLNFNVSGGIGAFYTYKSKIGVSIAWQKAYLDDIVGDRRNSIPGGDEDSYGIPANYRRASAIDIQTKFTTISWQKEVKYPIHIGYTRVYGRNAEIVGRVKGQIMQAITARLGYQLDDRIVESNSPSLPFVNATPEYQYHFQGQTYGLPATNLGTSSAMVRTNVITAGIGYSTFADIKIQLEDDTYKGRREDRSQTDLYADVLYAPSVKIEDMIYYHALEPRTGEYTHIPQRLDISSSPVNNLGFRLGYQALVMSSGHFGYKSVIELGMRPGPKTYSNDDKFYFSLGLAMIFGGTRNNAQ